jgi:hypothetical protein
MLSVHKLALCLTNAMLYATDPVRRCSDQNQPANTIIEVAFISRRL